jgi:hypothetical protein
VLIVKWNVAFALLPKFVVVFPVYVGISIGTSAPAQPTTSPR